MRAIAVLVIVGATTVSPAFTLRSEQQLPFAFNQGVARVDGGWIFCGTDSPIPGTDVLERTDDQLNVISAQPLPIPLAYRNQGYDHVGDIDVEGGILYVPFEQGDYSLGHQVTARYDPTTLAFIDAVELPQHENSFITVDAATMTAYTMDHFDGDTLLRYDVQAGWLPLPPLQLTMNLVHTQGADVANGAVWIATSDENNHVYRVDIQTGDTTSVGTLGHPGLEGEGIDATALPSGAFHGMINDPLGPFVFFDHFDLSDSSTADASATTSTSGGASGRLAVTGGRAVSAWLAVSLLGAAACAWHLRQRAS